MQISGHGNQESKRYSPGTLNVTLHPITDDILEVSKNGTIHIIKEISIEDWYNNKEVEINRYDVYTMTYNLSNLKQSDGKAIFSGKGLRSANNTNQGDFIVTFRINK